MTDPVASARLKIDRGREHLHAFMEQRKLFIDSKPYQSGLDNDPASEWAIATVTLTKELSPRAGLYVGDCIHNLRSALDHLAWSLVGKAIDDVSQRPRSTRFPIARTRTEFDKDIGKALPGVGLAEWTAVEGLQPYHFKDPNMHPLNYLERLDVDDKHKSGIIAAAAIFDTDITKSPDEVEVVSSLAESRFHYLALNRPAEVYRVRKRADGVNVQSKSRVDIVFHDDGALAGKVVHEVLAGLVEFTQNVITTFNDVAFG